MTTVRHSTIPFWISCGEEFLSATWFWPTAGVPQRPLAVLIVPGIAMEDRTISVGLMPLAESLSAAGVPTLLMALEGTGESSGDLSSADIANSWVTDIQRALDHMREVGFARIVVVAVRLSALTLLEALPASAVTGAVLWAPAFSGRRYARELSMLAVTGKAGRLERRADLPVIVGTFPLAADLLERFKSMKLTLAAAPVSRILVIDDPERLDNASIENLRLTGATVDVRVGAETASWLYTSSESAAVPRTDVDAVVDWMTALAGTPTAQPVRTPSVSASHEFVRDGIRIIERHVRFSRANLLGIYATPADATTDGSPAWVIVTSVQPGKGFVDFARDEAARGRPSLRFDLSSNGLSERRKRQGWGELNGRYGPIDAALAADWMQPAHPVLSLLGFCSGAIASINVAPRAAVRNIVAINPPVFIPKHSWRTSDGRSGSAFWKAVDKVDTRRIGGRLRWKFRRDWFRWSPSLHLLTLHRRRGTRVLLQYDDVDPGWVYLRRVFSKSLSLTGKDRTIEVSLYTDIDHLLDRPEGRKQVMADALAFGSRTE